MTSFAQMVLPPEDDKPHDLGGGWFAKFDATRLIIYSATTAFNLEQDSIRTLKRILNGEKTQ